QVLKRLDKAWTDFFKVPGRGFPRFRNKNRFRSFVFPQLGKNCLDAGVERRQELTGGSVNK
ncbi:MAG: hypothetical protein QNJ32_27380, partial [Xenococcaceae cyanobacterium MO_167.B27]|nr:hypothetical protein [Xenococcaceae cyanobacterium MO_167.B27]